MDGNVFCYCDDEGYLGFDGFFNCFWGLVGGDVDSGCIWPELFHCLGWLKWAI